MLNYISFIFILLASCYHCDEETMYVYNIAVLGNTGVGKSSPLNMLAGNETAFKVGQSINSETKNTTDQIHTYNGKSDNYTLRLIDTPGLADDAGEDEELKQINDMIEHIKPLKYIDLFIICLDGTNPRFTSYMKSMIEHFKKMFPDFLDNSVLVFNKWNEPNTTRRHDLISEYQDKFLTDYQLPSIPCFFIDSYYNLKMLRYNQDGSTSERYLHESIQAVSANQSDELIQYLVDKKNIADVSNLNEIRKSVMILVTGAIVGLVGMPGIPIIGEYVIYIGATLCRYIGSFI